MTKPADLLGGLRDDVAVLRQYGAEAEARVVEVCLDKFETALREEAAEALTLGEAAEASGYSERRLRELIADGTIPQAGRKGAPRIHRADLPAKPGANGTSTISSPGYDAEADADALAEAMG